MKLLQFSFAPLFLAAALLGSSCLLAYAQQAPPPPPIISPYVRAQPNDGVKIGDTGAAATVGTYTGFFEQDKITVSIEKIVGTTVLGYSVVKGNERAFSGPWERNAAAITIIGKEPGDNPTDGVFTLKFDPTEKLLVGQWAPNSKKLAPVNLVLKARAFKYDPKVGQYPKASTKLLKESDVENMRPAELRIMRNEIYARHGYSFTLEDMQKHFAAVDWYMPMVLDVKDNLTITESKNAALILRYEKYGGAYYDRFGR